MWLAEQERKKNRQLEAEGIEVARTEGVRFGKEYEDEGMVPIEGKNK